MHDYYKQTLRLKLGILVGVNKSEVMVWLQSKLGIFLCYSIAFPQAVTQIKLQETENILATGSKDVKNNDSQNQLNLQ